MNRKQQEAEKLLKEYYGNNITFPINPFELLNSKNVLITFSEFDKLEGIILLDSTNNKNLVSINVNRPIQRQRFTAAHELGHYMLHKNLELNTNFACPIYGTKSVIEKEADEFASYLLMPTKELNKIVDKYQDKNGNVNYEDCIYIADYFGVSFEACVKTICFRLNRFIDKRDNNYITEKIKNFRSLTKRKKLIGFKSDIELYSGAIKYTDYYKFNFDNTIGVKFVQELLFHDNHLEDSGLPKDEINDLFNRYRLNMIDEEFKENCNKEIIETLGNLEMNEYVLKTNDEIKVSKIKILNKLFYKYSPFPEYGGEYRNVDNLILGGKIQPVSYINIIDRVYALEDKLELIIKNIDNYSLFDYIKEVAYIHYELTIIHPFIDGNGRMSRAFLNWLLRIKNICPIYIDFSNKKEYLDALHEIDESGDCTELQLLIFKSILRTMCILTHKI